MNQLILRIKYIYSFYKKLCRRTIVCSLLLYLTTGITGLQAQNADIFPSIELHDLKAINNYTNSFRDTIISKIYAWENRSFISVAKEKKFPGQKIDSVRLFPIIKLNLQIDENEDSASIRDVSFGNYSEICAIAYPFSKVYWYQIKSNESGLLGHGQQLIELVRYAKEKGFRNFAFGYFLNDEQYKRDVIFEKVGGGYRFITLESGNILSLKDLLIKRYQSLSRYLYLRNRQALKDSVISNFDVKTQSEDFAKKSWMFHENYLPKDTLNNIKLFIQFMKESLAEGGEKEGLPPGKAHLLTKDIKETLEGKLNNLFQADSSSDIVFFMKKNIAPTLKNSLSQSQFKTLLKSCYIEGLKYSISDGYLSVLFWKKTVAQGSPVKNTI